MSDYAPTGGNFAGMTTAQLQAAYAAAQQALLAFSMGSKGESFSYTQGNGGKTVTFTRTTLPQLQMLVKQLQVALGIIPRTRRPMRFIYR